MISFIIIFLGCSNSTVDSDLVSWSLDDPVVTETELNCEDDEWTVIVQTEGWTGNGLVWIGSNERYERHPIYSIEAADDGTTDRLRIQLTSTADWRDAQSGSLTGFYCSEKEELSVYIIVRHPQTLDISDCVQLDGELSEPDSIWGSVDLPSCTP